jgi:hypothetical protein
MKHCWVATSPTGGRLPSPGEGERAEGVAQPFDQRDAADDGSNSAALLSGMASTSPCCLAPPSAGMYVDAVLYAASYSAPWLMAWTRPRAALAHY